MRVTVTTTATATIEETWEVEMTPEQFAEVQETPYVFLDWLATEDASVIRVTDRVTGDEREREVTAVAWMEMERT